MKNETKEKVIGTSGEPRQENKMGVMPVPKLLVTMSLPMILSMLVQALYNIVDSIYVSQIDENALTAVSLAFPIQSLMIAVATGTGVGINALLSRSLGEKNFEQADKTANNSLILAVLSYLVFCVFGLLGSRLFFASQTNDPQILEYGVQYLTIICGLSIGIFLQVTLDIPCQLLDTDLLRRSDMRKHAHPGHRGDPEHHLRPDPDLWLFRFPENGRGGSRGSDRLRTDRRDLPWHLLQSPEEP